MTDCPIEELFDHAGVGLCLVGPDGRVRRANAAFLGAVGLEGEVDGKTLEELFPLDPGIRSLLERARHGETVDVPVQVPPACGDAPWAGSLAPVRLEDGAGVLFTARGGARATTQELLDAVSSGVAVIAGPELRFALANPAYRATTPDPDLDPVGLRIEEVWAPEEAAPLRAAVERVIATGEPAHAERLERTLPGEVRRFFASHLRPVAWDGARAVLATVWETTSIEEQRARAQLAAAEARRRAAELDTILESIADALLLYNPTGEIVRMNAAAERLFGYAVHEFNKPLRERIALIGMETAEGGPFPPGQLPAERALRGETVRGVVMVLRRAASRVGPTWVSGSAAPIWAHDGALLGAVATLTDISQLHDLQEQHEDIVRTISHDLRTPLSVIAGQAHLLRRSADRPDDVRRRSDRIATSARRMNAMIQDLVDMARSESGQLALNLGLVDLGTFALELKERLATVESGRLRLCIPATVPPVVADSDRLERILVNLITNALKYSSEDREVVLGAECAGQDSVAIFVTDRGQGIAPEDLPRLFQRFARVRGSRKEGVGLGLYIARLLIEAHGGTIAVTSSPGAGSTFRVVLRAAAAPPATPAAEPA